MARSEKDVLPEEEADEEEGEEDEESEEEEDGDEDDEEDDSDASELDLTLDEVNASHGEALGTFINFMGGWSHPWRNR